MNAPTQAWLSSPAPGALAPSSRRGLHLSTASVASPHPFFTPPLHAAISMSIILEMASFLVHSCEERLSWSEDSNHLNSRIIRLSGKMSAWIRAVGSCKGTSCQGGVCCMYEARNITQEEDGQEVGRRTFDCSQPPF